MNTSKEQKRKVLVTGASKGIGKAIAITLAKQGFNIITHYNSDEAGALETKQEIEKQGGSAELMKFDISKRSY